MDKVSEIVAELRIGCAPAIEVIQNYWATAIDLEGYRAEPVKALFDDEVQAALAHARRLAKRIKALDGRVPGSVELPRAHKGLPPPADPTNLDSALLSAVKMQDAAIAQYDRVIQLCDGPDFVTLDLVIALLFDERERRQRLVALLAEGR